MSAVATTIPPYGLLSETGELLTTRKCGASHARFWELVTFKNVTKGICHVLCIRDCSCRNKSVSRMKMSRMGHPMRDNHILC